MKWKSKVEFEPFGGADESSVVEVRAHFGNRRDMLLNWRA